MGNGDLVLKSVNGDDDGLYQCTVANHVGYSVCVVEVKVSGRYSSSRIPRLGGLECGYLGFILEPQLVASPPALRLGLCLEQLEAICRFAYPLPSHVFLAGLPRALGSFPQTFALACARLSEA